MVKQAEEVLDEHRTIKDLFTKVMKDNIGMLAAFVSWSVLTSMVPILVGLVAISGLFLRDPGIQSSVESHLSSALQGVLAPADIHKLVLISVQHTGLLAIIGFLGVLWGGSNVGGSISTAFQPIFEVPGRSFIKEKLIDVGMILIFTVLMIVILAGTAAGALLNRLISGFPLPGFASLVIGTGISLLSAFLLFLSIYMVFPNINPRIRFHNVWKGALLAAVLFQILSFIWPIYSSFSHFSKYGSLLASILMLTAWIYFFAMIVMLGAEVVAVFSIREAKKDGESLGPEPEDSVPQHKVLRPGGENANQDDDLTVERRRKPERTPQHQGTSARMSPDYASTRPIGVHVPDERVERDPAFWLWAAAPLAVGTLAGLMEWVRAGHSR